MRREKKENQQTVRAHKRKVNYNEGELCSGKQKNEAQINAHHFGKNLNKQSDEASNDGE